MLNSVVWLLAAILCSRAAISQDRCDICRCQMSQNVLTLNCSDTDKNGVGELRQPDLASFQHFKYTNLIAEFERNEVTLLPVLSLVNVSELSLADNSLAVLGAGSFKRLVILKTLRLCRNHLHSLHGKAFQGLRKLELLDLSHNQLGRLDATVFSELKSLRILSLAHNRFHNLDGKLFANTALQSLDISFNVLQRVEKSVLEGLEHLRSLNLAHNNLTVVGNFIVAGLVSLTNLDISFNNISKLEPMTIESLKSLQNLSLSHNMLTDLPQFPVGLVSLSLGDNLLKDLGASVGKLKELKELRVEGNMLEDIQVIAKKLENMKSLELLDLSRNKLRRVHAAAFAKLKFLLTLSLAHNLIENLDGNTFANMALQSLDLSFNALERVEGNVLEGLRGLRSLNLAHNNLTVVDNFLLADLGSLTDLNLSSNKIARLEPSALANLVSLQSLSLSRNLLAEVPEFPARLVSLSLGGNLFKSIGTSVNNLMNLRELHLEDNQLKDLNVNFKHLQLMNVSHNLLATISLRNLPELEVLDVSGNQLNEVPADVTGAVLPALRWLSLDYNPIRQVSFPKPSGGADAEEREGERFLYLTFVSISHMDELTELDAGAFAGLLSPCGDCIDDSKDMEGAEMAALAQNCSRRLELRIAHNPRLTKVHPDAFTDVGTCSLDLSHNALSSLERGNVNWESVKKVDLQHNPWACTCSLQWVLDQIVPHALNSTPKLLHELRCASPAALRETRLVHFYDKKRPVLCSQSQRLMMDGGSSDNSNVTFQSSDAMLGVVVGLTVLAILLVAVGFFLHRRYKRRYRIRNRRF
ncbi:insulin-like growth factor-binding protein complex acid labile subunit isoform X3 [Periplaneta americana]